MLTSCTTNYTKIDNRKPYNAKGFAYIFNQADRDKNIIKGKMTQHLVGKGFEMDLISDAIAEVLQQNN